MRHFLIFIILTPSLLLAQQRIGADINTHLQNFNYSLHYQKVMKGPLLFSVGFFGGKYDMGSNMNDTTLVYGGYNLGIAYPQLTKSITNPEGTFLLGSTASIGHGLGITVGIGLFKEFKSYHGIRFNLNQRIGWMRSDVRSSYYRPFTYRRLYTYQNIWHGTAATTLELYHTYHFSGRHTFYWGVKAPYHYTLDKGRFKPQKSTEVFHQFTMDLSLGMTYAIGKCD
jgi:hypothetical protein